MNIISYFFISYVFSSIVIFLVFNKIFKLEEVASASNLFFLMLGLGPIMVGYLLYLLFFLAPEKNDGFYICVIISLLFFGFMAAIREVGALKRLAKGAMNALLKIKSWRWYEFLFLGVILFCVLLVFPQAILLPLSSTDGSIYFTTAKIFYEQKSLKGYPFITAHLPSGFYSTSSHTPVFQMLYVFAFLFEGGSNSKAVVQSTSAIFFLLDIIAISCLVLKRSNRLSGLLAGAILSSCPAFILTCSTNFSDSFCLYPLIFSIFALMELMEKPKKLSLIILAGLGLGLSLSVHSTHLIIVPLLFLSLFLVSKERIGKRIKKILLIGFITILIGGIGYLSNYLKTAALDAIFIQDVYANKVLELASRSYLMLREQLDPLDKIKKGKLQDFFELKYWGISAYLAISSLFLWIKFKEKKQIDWMLLLFASFFYIFVSDPFSLTDNKYGYGIWSNYRYRIPLLIATAYFSGLVLGSEPFANLLNSVQPNFIKKINLKGPILALVAFMCFIYSIKGEIEPKKSFQLLLFPHLRDHYFNQNMELRAIFDFVNVKAKKNDCFYTMSPKYFVYANRKGLYYLDARLENFYRTEDAQKKAVLLKELGVSYIFFEKSRKKARHYFFDELSDLINDPDFSEVVYENPKVVIYRLYYPPRNLPKHIILKGFYSLENFIAQGDKTEILNKKDMLANKLSWVLFTDSKYFMDEVDTFFDANKLSLKIKSDSTLTQKLTRFWNEFQGKQEYFILLSPAFVVNKRAEYKIYFQIRTEAQNKKWFKSNPWIKIFINKNMKDDTNLEENLDSAPLLVGSADFKLRYLPEDDVGSIRIALYFSNVRKEIHIEEFYVEEIQKNTP